VYAVGDVVAGRVEVGLDAEVLVASSAAAEAVVESTVVAEVVKVGSGAVYAAEALGDELVAAGMAIFEGDDEGGAAGAELLVAGPGTLVGPRGMMVTVEVTFAQW